jgi:rSAM/selenodomain-associated transferase 1
MAKASQPGRTKTRLVPPLSFEAAAQLNTSFLQDAIANIDAARQSAPVVAGLAYAPAGSESFFRNVLPGVPLLEAASADFGETLFRAATGFLDSGHNAVCLLNADTPDLPTTFLADAARILQEPGERVVLGPARDGGYYLIGLKQPHRGLFEGIAWSTERVLGQTRDRAAELSIDVRTLPEWDDVDDWAALNRLSGRLRASAGAPRPFPALNTIGALGGLFNTFEYPPRVATDIAISTCQPSARE